MRTIFHLLMALVLAVPLVVFGQSSGLPDASAAEPTCLNLGGERIERGDVTQDDWDAWTGIDLDFATNENFLDVLPSGDVLRQQFVPSSQGSARVLTEGEVVPSRTYTMTQSVYFEPGFDWGRDNQGGKLGFGVGGGTTPTGGEIDPAGFTSRFMWRGNNDGSARIVVYSYASDRTQNLPFGDDHELEGFTAPIGEWFTLTMEVTANSVGASDGRVRAWADGELALDLQGMRWQQTGGTPQVDRFIYSTFYGGNGWDWAPESTTYVQFRDVCWSPTVHEPAVQPIMGDVSCDRQLGVLDAVMIAQFSVRLRTGVETCPIDLATEVYLPAADINNSGTITVADALIVAQCFAGVDTTGFCPD